MVKITGYISLTRTTFYEIAQTFSNAFRPNNSIINFS